MTAIDTNTAPNVESARETLRDFANRIDHNPQYNSVFAYARKLFGELETGKITIDDLGALSQDVYADLIDQRAAKFRAQHMPADGSYQQKLTDRLNAIAEQGWDAYSASVQSETGGIVFTGHPTFALPKSARAAFANHVLEETSASKAELTQSLKDDNRTWAKSISLLGEHAESQDAIENAQAALTAYVDTVLNVAAQKFPDQWRTLKPYAPTIASWIGYDLDGRTDIHWSQSFAMRLQEKVTQLGRYKASVAALIETASGDVRTVLETIFERLGVAEGLTRKNADLFDADLTAPDTLVAAANALTENHDGQLNTLEPTIAELEATALIADPTLARQILTLAARMKTVRLGTARIHLRLNAAQIRTVISRDLKLETENRDLGRSALHKLSTLAATKDVLPVNFADLFLEQSTARRQFMMCAQFLKHIDADSTIRFLIAESENPATVMGALYLARQYGVAHQLDISPLFETPEALETGGRFIEQLLEEPEYMVYLKQRGYLSIQLGFSDAGRFIGQVAADMAIERIHNLISRAVSKADAPLSLLIFNTHGESMGRGAWPGTFKQRFDHLLSQWTRQQSRRRGVPLRHEVSFQGGDGFLHFANEELATATYSAFALHLLSEPDEGTEDDPFYTRTDLVWDFYRALRKWHERLFDNRDYARLLSDFAVNFPVKAGSRQRRRSSGPQGPRSLRAISHNATLQQLGVPLNTAAGIGSALRRERAQVNDLIRISPRMRHLIKLASMARSATSVPALRAYGAIYDPGFWVALTRSTEDSEQALAYRRIYYLLQDRQTNTSIEKIANMLSIDLSKFDPMLAEMEKAPSSAERHEGRLSVHVLHGVRQALMMKALAIAGRLPNVSERHEQSVGDIMGLIQTMQIGEAVSVLCTIFPASRENEIRLRALDETGHMTDSDANGYDQIHAEIIAPLDAIDRQLQTITLAICQAYGAFG